MNMYDIFYSYIKSIKYVRIQIQFNISHIMTFFALNAHQIYKMFKSQYSYNIYIMSIFFDCKNI